MFWCWCRYHSSQNCTGPFEFPIWIILDKWLGARHFCPQKRTELKRAQHAARGTSVDRVSYYSTCGRTKLSNYTGIDITCLYTSSWEFICDSITHSECPRHVERNNYVPLFGVDPIECRLTLLRNTWRDCYLNTVVPLYYIPILEYV